MKLHTYAGNFKLCEFDDMQVGYVHCARAKKVRKVVKLHYICTSMLYKLFTLVL